MFRVFIQDGEFELDDAAEVLKLLDAHDFHGDGDFFTIGRGDVDYLEIYQYGDRYSLAYIPPGADESHPLAEELPRPFARRSFDRGAGRGYDNVIYWHRSGP